MRMRSSNLWLLSRAPAVTLVASNQAQRKISNQAQRKILRWAWFEAITLVDMLQEDGEFFAVVSIILCSLIILFLRILEALSARAAAIACSTCMTRLYTDRMLQSDKNRSST